MKRRKTAKSILGAATWWSRAGSLGLLLAFLGSCASLSIDPVPARLPRAEGLASTDLVKPSINLDRSGRTHRQEIPLDPPGETSSETSLRNAYLSRALGAIERENLAGGIPLVLKKSPGKTMAAAVLVLPGLAGLDPEGKSGLGALALSLMARGNLDRSLAKAGAGLSLVELGSADLGLLIESPRKELPDLLALLAAAFVEPAFLKAGFPEAEFEASLRSLRLAERRRAQSPFGDSSGGKQNPSFSSLGSAAGLHGLGLEEARSFWIAAVPKIRPQIAVLGDFRAGELAAALASPLAGWKAGASVSARVDTDAPAQRQSPGAWPNAYDDRAAGILLAFFLPQGWSEESAALLVGLQLLEDSLIHEFELRGLGTQGLKIIDLPGGGGFGTISIARGVDRATARGAFETALALLLADRAATPGGGATTSLGAALDAAKARAVARAYKGMNGGDIVLAMGADLARGGDGCAFYRFEEAIANLKAEDVRRALAEGFAPERSVWFSPEKG